MKGGNGATIGSEITHRRAKRPSTNQKNQRQPVEEPKTSLGRGRSPQQEKEFYGGRHAREPDSTESFRTTSKGLQGRATSGGSYRLRRFVLHTSLRFVRRSGEMRQRLPRAGSSMSACGTENVRCSGECVIPFAALRGLKPTARNIEPL